MTPVTKEHEIPRPQPARTNTSTGQARPARSPRRGAPSPSYRSTAPRPARTRTPASHLRKDANEPQDRGEVPLRLVPVGGLEEIGRNCSFLEYKNEILLIDVGIQFPEEETPGIDFIIPNTAYLEGKRANIKGLILTHAHLDHIGALPYVIEKIGNPVIYTTALTKAIIEKRQEDFPNSPKLKVITIKNGEVHKISEHFEVEFFGVAHNIPDTTGINVRTPAGNIVHFADFKLDYDAHGEPQGLEEFARIGKQGIHTFMIDSTAATKPGKSLSEREVEKNLEALFTKAEGRVIVATFSSMITRIAEIIKICDRLGRKVAISGFSMKANVQIAQNLGFIKTEESTIIALDDIGKYRDNKVLVLTPGAQGESNGSLMKIINGEHRFVTIKPGDTVIFSSSVIPGNERNIQNMQDNLCRQGAIIYNNAIMDIHSSGHAPHDDLSVVMKLINPKFLVPVHGYYFMRSANAQIGREAGIPKENIFLLDNGEVANLRPGKFEMTKETVPAFYVMVDGLGVGDVEEVVLRDRRSLAQEGMVVIIVTVDRQTGKMLKNSDIISRGFIFLKEHQDILDEIRKRIRGVISRLPNSQQVEADYLKTIIRDQIGQYLYNRTRRRPMLLPVIIEI
jgi:ribonuclease J